MKSWRTRLVLIAFAASAVLTVVFAMRAVRHAPRRRNVDVSAPIRPWMSVPYIAHTHGVAPHVLYDALGLTPAKPHDKRPLRDIARAQNRSVEAVINDLQTAIAKEKRPPPSSTPAPPSRAIEPPPRPPEQMTKEKPPRTTQETTRETTREMAQ